MRDAATTYCFRNRNIGACGWQHLQEAGKEKGGDIREEEDVAANNRPFREEDEPAWSF
jgi:hypothetical protein